MRKLRIGKGEALREQFSKVCKQWRHTLNTAEVDENIRLPGPSGNTEKDVKRVGTRGND